MDAYSEFVSRQWQMRLRSVIERSRHGRFSVVAPDLVWIGDGVEIGAGSVIHPFSYISGRTRIGKNCVIGPYADIRDSVIGDNAEIEHAQLKRATVGADFRAKHHCYVGDAEIGANVNIGAGTVTCNYDGEKKNQTVIEDGAFVGSGSMLVAPVRIGAGAYVAAGSVITENVPPDALGISRSRQENKAGWANKRRKNKPPDAGR